MEFFPWLLLAVVINGSLCRKSDEKCKEYAKAVYVQQESPVLTRRSRTETVSECGIVSVPLIVGGVRANSKEFPHMALIGFDDPETKKVAWDCGGSLISDSYVLTAAHCVKSPNKGIAKHIKLGMVETNGNNAEEEQSRQVKKATAHPEYKRPSKYNDIALLEMDKAVAFTPYVRPACLSSDKSPSNTKAIATGFGKLTYRSTAGSDSLMKVTLDMISKDICQKAFAQDKLSFKNGLSDSVMCAGVLKGGKDTCQGDSGGPLQIILEKPYCMYHVIGVTSTGKFCGYENSPAIYTNVSGYLDWIESTVW